MNKYLQTAFKITGLGVAGAVLVETLVMIFCAFGRIDPLFYKIDDFDAPWGRWIWWSIGAAATVLMTIPWRAGWQERLTALEKILRPAWLLWFIPVTGFPGILLATAVIALVVFQLMGAWKKQLPELPEKYGKLIALAGGAVIAVWGYRLQVRAFDSMHFIWGDWNQYVEHYQHLLSGNARFVQWFAGAGHWNFGVNLIMTGLLKLYYAPDTVFIVNALCIASIVPLGYWLSRKCGLSSWMSVVLLILTAFNPVLSNQYLSLFYGFHPIVFFVPLLLGFFIAGEYKNRYLMAACFLLSLTVQETVCIFWAGYALYLLCQKQWKSGILLLLAMAGAFLFFSRVVIPAAHGAENYAQMFHYAHLGNNIFEVALSPFTRPAVFFKTVFERASICFALAVFVPFLFGVVFKPLMLVALLPIFAGVILQGSPDVKTVMLQYGLECTVFSMIVMILNLKYIYPELRRPAVTAVLLSTVLCGYFMGMVPGGKGPLKKVLARPDGRELIGFFDQAAGQSERIVATGRLRGQFQFIRPTASIKESLRPGDAVLLDLHDNGIEIGREVSAFRRKLAADKRVVPVTYVIWENHTIVMFRVLNREVTLPGVPWLRQIPEKSFVRAGKLLRTTENYEFRYAKINNRNVYRFLLKKICMNDIEFVIQQKERSGNESVAVVSFGNGLFPAYSVKPGTMFEFALPGENVTDIAAQIYEIK